MGNLAIICEQFTAKSFGERIFENWSAYGSLREPDTDGHVVQVRSCKPTFTLVDKEVYGRPTAYRTPYI